MINIAQLKKLVDSLPDQVDTLEAMSGQKTIVMIARSDVICINLLHKVNSIEVKLLN